MFDINLQFFGGRGGASAKASSSGGGSGTAGGSGGATGGTGGSGGAPHTTSNNGPSVQNQAPNQNNTPVNTSVDFSKMTDDQLAQNYRDSMKANLPNHLNDSYNATQQFVFHNGINAKPTVVDQAGFDKFMKDNNISKSQILARTISDSNIQTTAGSRSKFTANDIADQIKYSRLNYIGGKRGGNVYGNGTYFDMNGGRNTGYGYGGNSTTVKAVLNPATTRKIDSSTLRQKAASFDSKNPKFAKATGGFSRDNASVYALAMGYNVITSGSYHNIIDRSALVVLK